MSVKKQATKTEITPITSEEVLNLTKGADATPIVFIAIYPDRYGKVPTYVEEAADRFVVLHPSYNFENEEGQAILKKLAGTQEPEFLKVEHQYKRMLTRDYWAIEKSDIVVYEVDGDPGQHFLAAAVIYKKPILFVSEVLAAAPIYFSGFSEVLVKPSGVIQACSGTFKRSQA